MEKLTKLGITSLSVMALGAVAPLVAPDVFGANVVYAEESKPESFEVIVEYFGDTGKSLVDVAPASTVTVTPSNSYTVKHPQIDGWVPDKAFLNPIRGEGRFAEEGEVLSYDSFKNDGITDISNISYTYTPAKTPTEQPATPTQPETSTNKPTTGTVIHIGEEPTSPVNETSLYYTIETQFGDPKDGGRSVEETLNINAGETHEVEGLSDISKPWTTYRIMEGTPESYTITYDDVKAGKNHFVFRMYNTKTHNPDGTLKTEEKPATPADKPTNNQQPLKYRVYYNDLDTNTKLGSKEGTVSPGELIIEKAPDFPGYIPVNKRLGINYEGISSVAEGRDAGYNRFIHKDNDGVPYGQIDYVKPATPAEQPPTPPEVPATKPETPAEKPSDKPAEKPTTPEKPTEKPATKPTDTNKPVVKPADNGKPEVKPENKVEPKAEVKPTQQSGTAAANAQTLAPKADAKAPATAAPKADKPAEKKMETLPNTGESQSTLALLGLALGVLGLQGLIYKGRHDRKL